MSRGRKAAYWIGGIIAGLVLVVVGGTWAYIHVFSSDPEPAFSLNPGTTTATATAAASTAGASAGTASTTTTAATSTADDSSSNDRSTWQVADGSQAGYRVKEVLFGQSTEAVGRTNEVEGQLTISGTTANSASFTVQVDTIKSDESRRDSQFTQRIMSTSQFPTATFKLTQPIDFGSIPADKVEIKANATGDLTLRGVTKSVTFPVTARRNGANLEVSGSIPVVFADYKIPNPSTAGITTEDNGVLEFLLVFAQA